jgi:ElaB/YqjD/DUF883 family membrane-anchored ribosome-binding protein
MSPTQHKDSLQEEFNIQRLRRAWSRSTIQSVKNAIANRPGATLLFAVGIGVLLGCLIKRR